MHLEDRAKTMTFSGHQPDLFRWKRFSKTRAAAPKVQMNNDDIDHWMKRVEAASEFAVSEVFSLKKPSARSKVKGPAMALESVDQLYDHDEAYSEAQALLSDWMSTKLRLELEAGEDDSPLGDCDADSPQTQPLTPQAPAFLQIHNFDDLYTHLEQEAESTAVHSFLQELMEKEVVDSGIVEDLRMDTERDRRRQKDPRVTMEIRHQQVRESRARREQQREQQRRELAVRREAEAEARRRVQEQERVRRLQERKQEELLQREVVQLRKEMGEKRSIAQLARQMERERLDRKRSAGRTTQDLPTPLPLSPQAAQMQPEQPDAERLRRRQEAEARAHMLNLRCLQHHFSGWYSVVLEGRVRLGKAAALCDWRSQLRAWRAWRALVWARRVEREAQSTEEELRRHNRAWRVAVESDGRRVLRQCLGAWCSWSRAQREGRELRAQQDETRRKMAALLAAASSGRLADHATTDPPEQSQSPTQPRQAMQPAVECADSDLGRTPSAPVPGSAGSQWVSEPREAWQVTRRHAALSAKELSRAGEQPDSSQQGRGSGRGRLVLGGRFENRHAFQQELLEQQRRQLREQEETIQELQENQRLMMLRQEAERVAMATRKAQPAPQSRAAAAATPPQGSSAVGKQISCSTLPASRGVQGPSAPHHPTVRAMEERAKQRAERRREIEEMKRRKEEDKLVQLQAAEEERRRQEEAERQAAAEAKREERRLKRQKEQERQGRLERERQQQVRASEHYQHSLLLNKGLVPWKQLLDQSRKNTQLAEVHHRHSLLRKCLCSWLQTAGESLAAKEALAAELHRRILLRRSLHSWLKCKDYIAVLEERAQRFYRARLLRRTLLALLDLCTQERLAQWDRERLAQQHSHRRAMLSCLGAWRRLPRVLREERDREARREQLRRRVAEILPDFRT